MEHTRNALRRHLSPWMLALWLMLIALSQVYEVAGEDRPPISAKDEQ